ncbi:membrane-bound transcription factor site-2 protease homolog [Impatiens glandulifera]|uniref:membrane-bound transcription factor site-2 protease homolog n=1 Tax=Impatiens glandulifera TaxID=253017 RepID=UPI001FB0FD97|nr:membrane-bound transcription factor site-2 protease homolog [Impatiens glandulifera]
MAMEGRRQRRFGRGQKRNLLPIRYTNLSNTISCWYCDFKISLLNQPLYNLGQRYPRFLKAWFSVGVGFSLTCVIAVTMILFLWEYLNFVHILDENGNPSNSLFGISPVWRISINDFGHVCLSTIISVSAHEFGHALAAASEGIKMEYVAVFIAFLCPGALVSFNYDVLETIPRLTALRIYCAGIWHNAVCCLVCGLALLLLPILLHPLFIYGDAPMVLDVSPSSHFSGILYPGDLITSLDGIRIHTAQEWSSVAAKLHDQTFQSFNESHNSQFMIANGNNKGYCVSRSMIRLEEEIKDVQVSADQFTCPPDFAAFTNIPCLTDITEEEDNRQRKRSLICLVAAEVINLKKCGDGRMQLPFRNTSHCPCLEEESCLTPVQIPGVSWIEVTYSSPYLPGCWNLEMGSSCKGSFIVTGDLISITPSIKLTSYQPRFLFFKWANRLPNFLEKFLLCTCYVSVALALLNSLPVYFLDGEYILESSICCLNRLSPRMRLGLLSSCLIGGTVASIAMLTKLFFYAIL